MVEDYVLVVFVSVVGFVSVVIGVFGGLVVVSFIGGVFWMIFWWC